MLTKIQKYLQGDATKEEIREIETWIDSDPENEHFFKEQVRLSHYMNKNTTAVFDTEKAFQKVAATTRITKSNLKSATSTYRWYTIAATLIIIISSGLFWKHRKQTFIEPDAKKLVQLKSKQEESTGIELTLADGTKKILKANTEEQITDQYGNVIGQQKENILSFQEFTDEPDGKLKFNTIRVPKGEICTLLLSDGTKIWLNAESTFRFPQKFLKTEDIRTVSLQGEGYFEVTTNKEKPFIVSTDRAQIKVLGTRFNISSYKEDHSSKTTLVEGSVIVQSRLSKKHTKLTPGYQVAVDSGLRTLLPRKVNVEDFTAWKEKRLIFSNETFTEITKRIERSYGVTIRNNYKSLATKRFTGEFDVEDVESVLKTFSISKPFDYIIENNTITIKKKN